MPFVLLDPETWAAAVGGLTNILGLLNDKSTAKQIAALFKALSAIGVAEARFMIAVIWWVMHMSDAIPPMADNARKVSTDITKVTDNGKAAWTEFLTKRYPADMQALYNALSESSKNDGDSLAKQIADDLKPIEAEIAALEQWKKVTVTPAVNSWTAFLAQWNKDYLPPVTTLIQWLSSPAKLAQFATPAILTQAVTLLAGKPDMPLAQNLEQILIGTWPTLPAQTFDAFFALMDAEQ